MPVKNRNIDVVAEYTKSRPKNAANFVVIGKSSACTLTNLVIVDATRSC